MPPRAASPARTPALLCVAALAAAAAAAPSGRDAYRIAAGPYARKADGAAGPATGRHTVRGLSVAIEYLEPEARAAFVTALDGGADPFAVAPGRRELYHAFRVAFHNVSDTEVLFQAGNVLRIFDGGRRQDFPIDLTDLYRTAARAHDAADPDAMIARAAGIIFDSSTAIPRGGRLERLLVFGPPPEKWKEMRVLFSFLQIGTETHTVSFLFHRRPVKG
jgi:hypothetical protein